MKKNRRSKVKPSTEPLVSVIVPMFNHERFISNCLSSIKSCGYTNLEVLVIDDGSNDQSFNRAKAWIEEHGDFFARIDLIRQENSGVVVTLNRLISLSTGEFIFPLASDDMVYPNAINSLMAFYLKNCSEPTLLLSDVELVDLDENCIALSGAAYKGRDAKLLQQSRTYLTIDMMYDWGTPYQHQFYSRTLFDFCGGYDETIKYEDLYFALICSAKFCVKYAPITTRRYRIRPGETRSPGLTEVDLAPGPVRRKAMPYFNPLYSLFLCLLNIRNERTPGLGRTLARVSARLIWRVTRLTCRCFHKRVISDTYRDPSEKHH